ncbi:MAG: hypothetical protein KDD56_05865 [Bdellovibrionales bacterium]|nr:hypothetical protein [Bdellovibrionales bacterium]
MHQLVEKPVSKFRLYGAPAGLVLLLAFTISETIKEFSSKKTTESSHSDIYIDPVLNTEFVIQDLPDRRVSSVGNINEKSEFVETNPFSDLSIIDIQALNDDQLKLFLLVSKAEEQKPPLNIENLTRVELLKIALSMARK